MYKFLSGLLAIVIVGCSSTEKSYRTLSGFAQGTTYSIIYQHPQDIKDRIEGLLSDFDFSLSIYNPESLITALNENRTDSVDDWFDECFTISKQIHEKTDGLFEPTLRPLIAAYGFGGTQRRTIGASEIDSVRSLVGFSMLSIKDRQLIKSDKRIEIDFNAVAKGYSVDLVARMLDSLHIKNYMVEIGGEIVVRGVNSKGGLWRIGIDTPYQGNFTPGENLQTTLEISDRALATSGNYRKFIISDSGRCVTHTIDPRTMLPSQHNLLSATILAPSCALADGYATACMVGGLEWAKEFVAAQTDVDCYLIYAAADGSMQIFSTVTP